MVGRISAAALHGFMADRSHGVDVVTTRHPRGGRGIDVTRTRRLPAEHVMRRHGIPVTTPLRTVLDLAQHGIRVNAVAPGEISTPMTGQEDEDPHAQERPATPLGRPGHADEMAAVIAFLAGEQSGYVTGASWVADGGLTLMAAEQERVAPGRG